MIRESLDDIIGIVHAKQILSNLPNAKHRKMEDIMQDAFLVPGSREIEDLLADMQRLKRHMAIVLDEYGGMAGLVTIEDILEELVGEIVDEYEPTEPIPVATAIGHRYHPGRNPHGLVRPKNPRYR